MSLPKSSDIFVKHDDGQIELSPGYVDAVKSLMREEIIMMRKFYKDPEFWAAGVAAINDLSQSQGIKFIYGNKTDIPWLKKQGQIFIEVD